MNISFRERCAPSKARGKEKPLRAPATSRQRRPLYLEVTAMTGVPRAAPPGSRQQTTVIHTTLLELVQAINSMIDDDTQVVATIVHLINSGRVQLTGTFKNTRLIIE